MINYFRINELHHGHLSILGPYGLTVVFYWPSKSKICSAGKNSLYQAIVHTKEPDSATDIVSQPEEDATQRFFSVT